MGTFLALSGGMPVAGAVQMRDRLDRYQLVERIGRGGMAEVFRARVQSLGGFERDVAVKVLLPQFASEPEFVDMLLDEARIAGAIVHPCVVQVLDVGRQGDVFYIVMEYVRGQDLRTIARAVTGAKLPLPMALYTVGEVLRGLHAVHCAVDDQGKPRRIVHRDVSPANVLIDESGAVKLGDFGIAHASGRLTRTRTGSVKGKSRYMAPEQLMAKPVDHRADLYAVGVTLFEALLGDVARESSYATPYGPMFTWPRRVPAELVPPDVAEILRRAVVDDPNARFRDAAEFRRAVVGALARHAPGYDAEYLARDLRRLHGDPDDDGFGSDIAESTDVATELRPERPRLALVTRTPTPPGLRTFDSTRPPTVTPTTPSSAVRTLDARPATPTLPEPVGARTLPAPALYDHEMRPTSPFFGQLTSSLRLGPRPSKTLLLTIGAAGATALLIAIIIAVASGPSAPPVPAAMAQPPAAALAPRATPLAPPRATVGVLAVSGPAGARPSIGAVVYPPAPCSVELPPGEYDVRLRSRRHVVTRHVTIEAGRTTDL
jgi:eukaryotic-like serine/threonine-protein kinase